MSTIPSISLVLYDKKTGEVATIGKSLNMNTARPGEYTDPVVIRMFVEGVSKIDNVRIAVVGGSSETVGSGTENEDGSVSSGNAGIEHTETIEDKSELTSFFPGKNDTGTSTGGNLVSVNTLTRNSTEYIYLNRLMGEPGSGYIKYKWFFDLA
jgi:hypothetical protein